MAVGNDGYLSWPAVPFWTDRAYYQKAESRKQKAESRKQKAESRRCLYSITSPSSVSTTHLGKELCCPLKDGEGPVLLVLEFPAFLDHVYKTKDSMG